MGGHALPGGSALQQLHRRGRQRVHPAVHTGGKLPSNAPRFRTRGIEELCLVVPGARLLPGLTAPRFTGKWLEHERILVCQAFCVSRASLNPFHVPRRYHCVVGGRRRVIAFSHCLHCLKADVFVHIQLDRHEWGGGTFNAFPLSLLESRWCEWLFCSQLCRSSF